jgi:Flp pilus assembly protein TadG
MIGPMIGSFAALGRDRRGVAALEFGLIASAMIVLFIGCFEVSYLLQADAKVMLATQELAELVAAQSTVTDADMADFCTGAQMTLRPLSAGGLSATVVSVTNPGNGTAALDWQDTSCGTAASNIVNPTGSVLSIIANDGEDSTLVQSAIMVEASYVYKSPLSFLLPATMTLTGQAFARPRNNATVNHQ